jgi:CDP-4-dehydro-6-deoxyglucose reductase, E1
MNAPYRPLLPRKTFFPGVTQILTGEALIDGDEKLLMHESVESGWLTGGKYVGQFEKAFAELVGAKHVVSCNSGSSANLLAVAAMVELGHWKAGDHILCIAASFPTTINPLMLYGLVPVFVDITLPDYSVNMDELEAAYSPMVKGVMIAHTLGVPYDMDRMQTFVDAYGLKVIEDCCDALGSTYNGVHVGSIGHMNTCSFFPAHHISTGEGGAVWTNSGRMRKKLKSLRDWGRDCFCDPGQENMCGTRFTQQIGTLPYGNDHKYTYSAMGFNLKMVDVSAACGLAQVRKAKFFDERRRENFKDAYELLKPLGGYLVLPEATPGSDPSWFGFPILLKQPGQRRNLQVFLDKAKISTRLIFGGNLIRQPYMEGKQYLVASTLVNTDRIMNDALWFGMYPGLDTRHYTFIAQKLQEFFAEVGTGVAA